MYIASIAFRMVSADLEETIKFSLSGQVSAHWLAVKETVLGL